MNREISKLNYRIYTNAIKDNLIPLKLTPAQVAYTYANEADMLNVVLFGEMQQIAVLVPELTECCKQKDPVRFDSIINKIRDELMVIKEDCIKLQF